MRRSHISCLREARAYKEVIAKWTHTAANYDSIDAYISYEWPTICAELMKHPLGNGVSPQPPRGLPAPNGDEFATRLATVEANPLESQGEE